MLAVAHHPHLQPPPVPLIAMAEEPGNNDIGKMSQQDMIQSFHRMEGTFFRRLVHDLGQDPTKMRWVLAFWLWLESDGHHDFVHRAYRMPGAVVLRVVEEALACLRCLAGEAPDMDSRASRLRCTNAFLSRPVGDVAYFADDERRAKVLEAVNYFYKNVSLIACVGNANTARAAQPRINNSPDCREPTPTVTMPSSPARRAPSRPVMTSRAPGRAAPPPANSRSAAPARVAPQRMTSFPPPGHREPQRVSSLPGQREPQMASSLTRHGAPQMASSFTDHGAPHMMTLFPGHGQPQMVSAPVHAAAPVMMTSAPVVHAAPQMMMTAPAVYAAPAPQMMAPDPAALQMVSYAAPPMMMVPPPAYAAPPMMITNSPDPAALQMTMSSSYQVAPPMLNPMASPWAPMEVQSTMPDDYRSPLPEDYRSLFVTFSKGHPVSRDDIFEFFNS